MIYELKLNITEVEDLMGDYSKAKRKLGWKPKITIKEGIVETLKYFKENNF